MATTSSSGASGSTDSPNDPTTSPLPAAASAPPLTASTPRSVRGSHHPSHPDSSGGGGRLGSVSMLLDNGGGGDTTTNEEATEEEGDGLQDGRRSGMGGPRDPEEALHPEWLDEIRFMSYRTAAKLRLLQKRTGLVQIDIWNMIEAFRENGLNVADPEARITRPRLETLVGSLYANLAKRLPVPQGGGPNSHRPKLESMASWLLSWLLTALNPSQNEKNLQLKIRTLKTSLAVLCSGKLMDKLRYVYSLISDENGHLVHAKYASFVRDVVRIPRAVGEELFKQQPSAAQINTFEPGSLVTLNDFLEALMSDPGPQCLSWLPVLHRIVAAESVVHSGLVCGSCGLKGFRGLRYKSDRSKNYHLCQWCFWRGLIPPEHRDDVFKEFNSFKNASHHGANAGGSGHHASGGGSGGGNASSSGCSLKKSFHCLTGNGNKSNKFPKFPEQEIPLDLSEMMIPSPLPSIRSAANNQQFPLPRHQPRQPPPYSASYEAENYGNSQQQHHVSDLQQQQKYDDVIGSASSHQFVGDESSEHQLIAHFAQEIGNTGSGPGTVHMQHHQIPAGNGINTTPDPAGSKPQMLQQSRELVYELERKNQEIMHDIERLRQSHRGSSSSQQKKKSKNGGGGGVMSELQGLRSHKVELESRLEELQCARKDLMEELDELMKLLKVQQDPRQQGQGPVFQGQMQQQPLQPQQQQHYLMPAAGAVPGGIAPPSAQAAPQLLDVINSAAETNHSFTNISGLGIEQMAGGGGVQQMADYMQQPQYQMPYAPPPPTADGDFYPPHPVQQQLHQQQLLQQHQQLQQQQQQLLQQQQEMMWAYQQVSGGGSVAAAAAVTEPQYAEVAVSRPPVIGGSTTPSPNRIGSSKDKAAASKHVRKASAKRLEKSKAVVVEDDSEVAAVVDGRAPPPTSNSRPGSASKHHQQQQDQQQRPGSRNASVVSLSE